MLDALAVRIRRGEGGERSEYEPRIHREEKPARALEGKRSCKSPPFERFAERNRGSGSLRDAHRLPLAGISRYVCVCLPTSQVANLREEAFALVKRLLPNELLETPRFKRRRIDSPSRNRVPGPHTGCHRARQLVPPARCPLANRRRECVHKGWATRRRRGAHDETPRSQGVSVNTAPVPVHLPLCSLPTRQRAAQPPSSSSPAGPAGCVRAIAPPAQPSDCSTAIAAQPCAACARRVPHQAGRSTAIVAQPLASFGDLRRRGQPG